MLPWGRSLCKNKKISFILRNVVDEVKSWPEGVTTVALRDGGK
jgi:hypothetical protein